jgi:septal ring factor EnvC (AmiA/AmiB activator)
VLQADKKIAEQGKELQATQAKLEQVQKKADELEAELTEAEAQGRSSKQNMQVCAALHHHFLGHAVPHRPIALHVSTRHIATRAVRQHGPYAWPGPLTASNEGHLACRYTD